MKLQHIIGADLSKKSIDLVCHLLNNHIQIENNLQGLKNLLNGLQQQKINPSKLMIVMEHTGLYSFCFEKFLTSSIKLLFPKSMRWLLNDLWDWCGAKLISWMLQELLPMATKKKISLLLMLPASRCPATPANAAFYSGTD